MKWNLQSNSWEVSLRLHPQDLERALSAERSQEKPNERVSVDDDGFSDLATKYLGTRFFVRRTPHAVNAADSTKRPAGTTQTLVCPSHPARHGRTSGEHRCHRSNESGKILAAVSIGTGVSRDEAEEQTAYREVKYSTGIGIPMRMPSTTMFRFTIP